MACVSGSGVESPNTVAQRHHFLPQVYLRQWSRNGLVRRYRRIGPDARLKSERIAPKSIAYERGLYTLPQGGIANGYTGDQIESILARKVDERFPVIVEQSSKLDGIIEDPLARDILWLIQTFLARGPRSLAQTKTAVAQVVTERRELIERMLSRARTSKVRSKIMQFADPRMPSVHALASLSAVIENKLPGQESWIEGSVVILPLDDVRRQLQIAGLDEFVTFEEPVVEWAEGKGTPLTTIALSPSILVAVMPNETPIDDLPALALRHCILPLEMRESVICSDELANDALYREQMAKRLLRWTRSGR